MFSSKQLELPALKQYAASLKLDGDVFSKCPDSGEQAGDQLAEFERLGLQGTPSFFVNGRIATGVLSLEQFRALIDEELNSHGAWK